MGLIDTAIAEGIREGIEAAAAERCEGRDHPDERCPNKPEQCVCSWVHWKGLPWWSRIGRKPPPRPSERDVMQNMIRNAVENFVGERE